MTSAKLCFASSLLLIAFTNAAIAQGDDPARAGAVLERDPLIFDLNNGGTVRVFHGPENDEFEKRIFDWALMEYYYLPQLALAKMANDSFAEVRQIDEEVYIFFQLTPLKIDRFELLENIHKSVNPSALADHVSPLSYEHLTVEVLESSLTTPVVVPPSGFSLTRGSLDISLPVTHGPENDIAATLKTGGEIAQAINDGSALPIASFEIIQQLGANQTMAKIDLEVSHK